MGWSPYLLEKQHVFKEGQDSSWVGGKNTLFYQSIADAALILGSVDEKAP